MNHNALLLEGEGNDGELEKLKCHIESLLDEQEKRKMPTGTTHDGKMIEIGAVRQFITLVFLFLFVFFMKL